jgi:hypothetical protein
MSRLAGDRAIGFRDQSQTAMLDRSQTDFDKIMELLQDYFAPSLWRRLGLRINETVRLDGPHP